MNFAHVELKQPKNKWTSGDLRTGLFLILAGIEKEWGLGPHELADVLHRPHTTVADWKTKGRVHVSEVRPDANDAAIYEFIEFYDSVSSFFARIPDQIKWLKTKSEDFKNESPLDLLKKDVRNLYSLREWIDRLARP